MTVTLVAGHIKPFDLGKWISLDEGGVWVTRKLEVYMVGQGVNGNPAIIMGLNSHDGRHVDRVIDSFEYIQITAMTKGGLLPAHLAGIRKVDPVIHHGDLDMK